MVSEIIAEYICLQWKIYGMLYYKNAASCKHSTNGLVW